MKRKILKFGFNNPIESQNTNGGSMAKKKATKKKASKKKVVRKKKATKKKVAKKATRRKASKKVTKKKATKKKVAKKKVAKKKATKKKASKRRTPAQKRATARLVKANKARAKARKSPAKKKATKKKAKRKSSSSSTKTVMKKLSKRSKGLARKKRVNARNKMKKGTAIVQTWKGAGRRKGKKHVKWEKMLVTKRTNPRKRKYKKRKNPIGGTMGKITKKINEYTQHNVSEISGLFAGGVVHQLSNDLVTKYFPNATAKLEGKLGAFAGSVTPILIGALLTKFGGKNKQVKSLAKGLVGSGVVGLGLATYEVVSPINTEMAGISYADAQIIDDEMNGLETDDFGALETDDFGALEFDEFSGTEQDEDYYGETMGTES
jgi:hypothetical protein